MTGTTFFVRAEIHNSLMGRAILMAVAGTLLAASGCATYSSFVPVGPGTTGGPAVRYAVPPESPQGEVYVTSFGFTELDPGTGQPGSMLHVRLAVSNRSASPWVIDGRQQALVASGYPRLTPAFANSDAGTGPMYVVPPGRDNVFDFYYTVAPPLGGFAIDWSVEASGRMVAERTPFLRVEEPSAAYTAYPPYVAIGLGFGVGWWYGAPYYHPYGYYHYPPVVRRYYYPPVYGHNGGWRTNPSPYRATPPGTAQGRPAPAHGGWHGSPASHGGHR